MLGTEADLREICAARILFMDGTFDTAPKLFKQMYVMITADRNTGKYYPRIWCFLPDKSQSTYTQLLISLKSAAEEISLEMTPHKIMMDFELAMIGSVRTNFGRTVDLKGCDYHFTNANHRRFMKIGLGSEYMHNKEVEDFFRMIIGLSMLPPTHIPTTFKKIKENHVPSDPTDPTILEKATKFLEYFDSTWINGPYETSMWSQWGCAMEPRTNNPCEGYNSRLKRRAGLSRNVYSVIKVIQDEQYQKECDIAAGSPLVRNKVYVENDKKLQKYAEDYEAKRIDDIQYIKMCSYLLKNVK